MVYRMQEYQMRIFYAQKKRGRGKRKSVSEESKLNHDWRNQISSIGKDLQLHQYLVSLLFSTQLSIHPPIKRQEMLCIPKCSTID